MTLSEYLLNILRLVDLEVDARLAQRIQEQGEPATYTVVSGVLTMLYPERLVFYDAECIYSTEDMADLINEYAQATNGEWSVDNLAIEWTSEIVSVSFSFRGQEIQWVFEQESDYVSIDFTGAISDFVEEHLEGRFARIHTGDQCVMLFYLPRDIATAVALLSWLEDEQLSTTETVTLMKRFTLAHSKGLVHELTLVEQDTFFSFNDMLQAIFGSEQ